MVLVAAWAVACMGQEQGVCTEAAAWEREACMAVGAPCMVTAPCTAGAA